MDISVVFGTGVTIQYKLAKLRSGPSASGSRQNCKNINTTLSLLVMHCLKDEVASLDDSFHVLQLVGGVKSQSVSALVAVHCPRGELGMKIQCV